MEYVIIGGISLLGYALSTKGKALRHKVYSTAPYTPPPDAAVVRDPVGMVRRGLPYYRSTKTQGHSEALSQRKVELFTGADSLYTPKGELAPSRLVSSGPVTSSGQALVPTAYHQMEARAMDFGVTPVHNNIGPGEQQRVGPGIGTSPDTDAGTHGLHPLYRVLPGNANEYRKHHLGKLPVVRGLPVTGGHAARPAQDTPDRPRESIPKSFVAREPMPSQADVHAAAMPGAPDVKSRRGPHDETPWTAVGPLGPAPGFQTGLPDRSGGSTLHRPGKRARQDSPWDLVSAPADPQARRGQAPSPKDTKRGDLALEPGNKGVQTGLVGRTVRNVVMRDTQRMHTGHVGIAGYSTNQHLGPGGLDAQRAPQSFSQPPVGAGHREGAAAGARGVMHVPDDKAIEARYTTPGDVSVYAPAPGAMRQRALDAIDAGTVGNPNAYTVAGMYPATPAAASTYNKLPVTNTRWGL